MDYQKCRQKLEAVLFASGDPVELDRLCEITETDKTTALKVLQMLMDDYDERESALMIVRLNQSYQMCARAEYGDMIRRALESKRNIPLSQAALEVLAIIAYNQPVTKSFIEQVRGIDSSSIVNNLAEKGLVEEAGRLDIPGRPISYVTTLNFLRCFSLNSLQDLPPIPGRGEAREGLETEEMELPDEGGDEDL